MINAYKKYWKLYFDFKGCSSRSDFWWTFLCNTILWVIILIMFLINPKLSVNIVHIWLLVNIIPGLAIADRRFHDANVSGWWLFTFVATSVILKILAVISVIVAGAGSIAGYNKSLYVGGSLAVLSVLIQLGCLIATFVIEVQPSSNKSRWRANNGKED